MASQPKEKRLPDSTVATVSDPAVSVLLAKLRDSDKGMRTGAALALLPLAELRQHPRPSLHQQDAR